MQQTDYRAALLSVSLVLMAGSASAQNASLDDGLWSGGLRKTGAHPAESLQVRVKTFGDLRKVEVGLDRWDQKSASCTYLAAGTGALSLVVSESNIIEHCPKTTSVDVITASPDTAEVSVQGFADGVTLHSAFPAPSSFPAPAQPRHAVDILKISPNMPEDEALKIAAELGFVPAFETDDNKGPIVLGRGEKFKAYPDRKEEFPDLLTLNVVDTPRGRMVASVHRAEVFPDKDQAADPYISAFLEKYGENPSSGWKFKYDGQREYGFNPCGEVPIILEPRGLGRTPTTGVSLTVRQTDASCAYQTDYQISDMGGVIRGYAVMSVSPFVHYESIYPQWAEKQAEELRDATRLQSSTSAPEL